MSKRNFKHLWMIEKRNRDGREAEYWTKIGVAFENRDGSFNLELAAVPVSGRLQMRDPKPANTDGAGDNTGAAVELAA